MAGRRNNAARPPSKIAMRVQLLVALMFPLCCGCERTSPAQRREPTAPTAAPHRATQPSASPLTAERIFQALTAHTWTTARPGADHRPGPDHHVWAFAPDGTWTTQHITDFTTTPRTGKWNLQGGSRHAAGDWFVCFDDGRRVRFAARADGSLGWHYPDKPVTPDPRYSVAALPPLTLAAEVVRTAAQLTARGWKRANDLDLRREPTLVRFAPDWTYAADYRHGQCTSLGTWYATADEIQASSPDGHCDARPGTGGDQFSASVIDDARILISGDLYVPEDKPVERGVIWALFGYEQVTPIRIQYDMPLRKGVPARFDVTITNKGRWPLTLQRFSLTGEYSNYGRDAGGGGKAAVPPKEIAAVNLANLELAPEKSHAFALEATFPEAGERWLYFNALVSGPTQNWDTHTAHELTVRRAE
jgi:hypothetical protein